MGTWKSEYSVGNAVMDTQHHKLLDMCDRAAELLQASGPGRHGELHALLNGLVDYAREHFTQEEALLRQASYGDLRPHIEEHEDYVANLTGFLVDATAGLLDRAGLHQYLSDWWVNHILDSDMKYRGRLAA